ncbi:MAG: polysaccharide deacetylase family protein [Candidatus Eremiobacteraeota bacterium]|nr:polysaccharide deacetylase family protein [Candidatus Eremiobacteraeota bacterium]
MLALTFDDGPYPVTTPLLLDRLRDLGVPATFFVIGEDAQRYPELTRRMAQDGNEVSNHTFTHPDLERLSAARIARELDVTRITVLPLTNERAAAQRMRPPHGRYDEAAIRAIQAAGYDVVLWNDDPGDLRRVPPQVIATHIFAYATAPEIMLLHNGILPTIDLLSEIVPRYRAAGYRFVTVGELLRDVTPARLNRPHRAPV